MLANKLVKQFLGLLFSLCCSKKAELNALNVGSCADGTLCIQIPTPALISQELAVRMHQLRPTC